MSELAFNANGESFEAPATVTGWRVRRMKPRGAPELVYGQDGRPLTISIDADMDELREAVGGVLGRYRLDPINDEGRCIDSVPPAYIQVVKAQRNAGGISDSSSSLALSDSENDNTVREAMRLNTELAKAVIDRFPQMVEAAATLLRAADGAGLPARPGTLLLDDEGEGDEAASTGGFDLNALVAQVVPMIVMSLAGGSNKPKLNLGSVLDWRKAAKPAKQSASEAPTEVEPEVTTTQEAVTPQPTIEPKMMAHFIAIQSALKPEEAALAREVASTLGPAELRGWIEELGKLTVPQAVQKIRVLIAGNTEAVS